MKILKAIWAWFLGLFRIRGRKSPLKVSREDWVGFVKSFSFDHQPSSVKPRLFADIMSSKGF